jgi:glyoxylase-like metal-dependent hydrolase (beta-lactamase superfamily II)
MQQRYLLMSTVTKLSPGVWQISLPFQGEHEIVGSYLLAGNNDLALIDPGPTSMLEPLLASIREAGFEARDVTHILATHIHLDHAGAAGSLMRHMPQAQVYAHSLGAPHLLDTGKVVASAARIYGDRMQLLWGDIEPVPYERLRVIDEGDIIRVAGRSLNVYYAPGHAIHHVIFFDYQSGELWAGDVAGVRLPGIDYVRPPTPPPDLDLEAWSGSLDLINRLQPTTVYMGHFGPTTNVPQHLERLREKLYTWGEFVLSAMRSGHTEAEIIPLLIAHTEPELRQITGNDAHALKRYEIATNYAMTVQGYMRYWKKRHPEQL